MTIEELVEQSLLDWGRAREQVLYLLEWHVATKMAKDEIWAAVCDYEEKARARSRIAVISGVMQMGE